MNYSWVFFFFSTSSICCMWSNLQKKHIHVMNFWYELDTNANRSKFNGHKISTWTSELFRFWVDFQWYPAHMLICWFVLVYTKGNHRTNMHSFSDYGKKKKSLIYIHDVFQISISNLTQINSMIQRQRRISQHHVLIYLVKNLMPLNILIGINWY